MDGCAWEIPQPKLRRLLEVRDVHKTVVVEVAADYSSVPSLEPNAVT